MAEPGPDPAGLSAHPLTPASLPEGWWRARGQWAGLCVPSCLESAQETDGVMLITAFVGIE